MNYSPKQGVKSHGLPHDPFKSSTVPRPMVGFLQYLKKVKITWRRTVNIKILHGIPQW